MVLIEQISAGTVKILTVLVSTEEFISVAASRVYGVYAGPSSYHHLWLSNHCLQCALEVSPHIFTTHHATMLPLITFAMIVEMVKRGVIMTSLIIIMEVTMAVWIREPMLTFARVPAFWMIPKITNEMFEIAYKDLAMKEDVLSFDYLYKSTIRRRRSPLVVTV